MGFREIFMGRTVRDDTGRVAVFCQTVRVTLTGSVTDAEGRTLQGAQVTVDPGAESAVSDAQGLFTLAALPNGEYTVTIKYKGFIRGRGP